MARESAASPHTDPQDREAIKQAHENLKFGVSELDDFAIGRQGVTFRYEPGLPHVIQAFEPAGRYFFTYPKLKPYIKANGPLGQFVR